MLVVLQEDEVVRGDRGVRREEQPYLRLTALDRRHGDGTAGVRGLEFLEFETVRVGQALQAERSLRALGRPGQDERAGDGRST